MIGWCQADLKSVANSGGGGGVHKEPQHVSPPWYSSKYFYAQKCTLFSPDDIFLVYPFTFSTGTLIFKGILHIISLT